MMGRKLGLESMVWTRRKKETSNQKRMKKQEFKKMMRSLGNSGATLNVPTSESQGFQRRRQRAEIENLLEQIMKENFPNMVKEIDF